MMLQTILKLGRVSNLPTVWTNALAGAVLTNRPDLDTVLIGGLALTAFYTGGMWLNDAFDADIDAREKADRPIPMGEISRSAVFATGFALLGLGTLLAFTMGALAGLAGLALTASVILYDWLHKRTALSPVIMGATRFFCYLLPAAAIGLMTGPLILGAIGLLAYVIGLTYAAKQEAYNRIGSIWPLAILALPLLYAASRIDSLPGLLIWLALAATLAASLRLLFRRAPGDVPRAVVTMIAGISLYDASLIATAGHLSLALLAIAGFALTLLLQKLVSGT